MDTEIEIEICINSENEEAVRKSVSAAYEGGADRVELCSAMHLEGLTPPEAHIRAAREAFQERPGLLVMIRPRGGDFSFTNEELALMQQQIDIAADCGADGVVLGVLKEMDQTIDQSALNTLVKQARSHKNLKITFHRAFDATPDRSEALATLIETGVDRVLTSGTSWGTSGTVLDGIEEISALVEQADGRIEIVIGGGITLSNTGSVLSELPSDSKLISLHTYQGVLDGEFTSASKIKELVGLLKN